MRRSIVPLQYKVLRHTDKWKYKYIYQRTISFKSTCFSKSRVYTICIILHFSYTCTFNNEHCIILLSSK